MKIEQLPQQAHGLMTGHDDALSQRLLFWRRSVAKHKFAILFLTLLIGALAWFLASSLTPIYRATSTLFIESSKSKVVSIEEVYGGPSGNREHIQTQAEIIKSRELAAKLVKRLNLVTHPAVDPRQRPPEFNIAARLGNYIPAGLLSQASPPGSDESALDGAIGEVQRNLDVQLVRNSQLIKVSFESSDKALATLVANTLPEIYIENDLEARLQMTQKAASWLTGRLKGLRENVETAERALQQYRDREKIIDAKGVALGASRQLDELTTTMVSSRQKASEMENAYQQVQAVLKGQSRATLETIPAVLRNPAVAKAKEAEAEAERRMAEASKRYGAEHPRMVAAESDLRSARDNTRKTVDSVVTSITREYEVAKATERSSASQLDKAQTEIQSIGRKEFQLASLERDVQTNRQLYDLFMNRFKETSAAGDLQSTIARVIDPAVLPAGPVRPRQDLIIGVALALGLVLSILLASLLEHLDNTVHTTKDVESKLGSALLGILPRVRGRKNMAQAADLFRRAAGMGHAAAQNAFAYMLQYGLGLAKDEAAAAQWYERSALQGLADAQHNLAWMLQEGSGIHRDIEQAQTWYRKASDQGHATAPFQLGLLNETGMLGAKDRAAALTWYAIAAERGHAMAQFKMGEALLVSKDAAEVSKGISWLEKSATQGNPLAQSLLATRGAARLDARVIELATQAAGQGVPAAQRLLASAYEQGKAIAKDPALAISWYREAATRGDADAPLPLAKLLDRGPRATQDPVEAAQWYQKASAMGQSEADLLLAHLYEEGRGIGRDYAMAFRHYERAAEKGSTEALYRMAVFYDEGKGVARDTRRARDAYAAAADKGHAGAREFLDRLLRPAERDRDPFDPFKMRPF